MSLIDQNVPFQGLVQHFATELSHKIKDELGEIKDELREIKDEFREIKDGLRAVQEQNLELLANQRILKEENTDLKEENIALKDRIEDIFRHFNAAIRKIHEKDGERRVTFEDLQVDVAETVIDTSRLEDEQNEFDKRLEAVVLRQDVMEEESELFKKTTKSQARGLEKGLEVLEQMITIPGRVHSEDVHSEHDRGAYVLQLNDHVQQQNSQLGRQVYNPHGLAQDSRVEDEAEVYDLRYRMNTPHGNFGDEVMDSEEEHHSSAVEDGDQEMTDVEFTVWLDNNGDLQTDHPYKDDDDAWEELTAAWALQKEEFINEAEENEVDWLSLDLHKHSSRCLRTALFPRTHRWTKANPGEYACRGCTNTQKICFGQLNGRFVALPLPNEAIRKDDPTIMQFYIAVRSRVTRSYHCGNLWED